MKPINLFDIKPLSWKELVFNGFSGLCRIQELTKLALETFLEKEKPFYTTPVASAVWNIQAQLLKTSGGSVFRNIKFLGNMRDFFYIFTFGLFVSAFCYSCGGSLRKKVSTLFQDIEDGRKDHVRKISLFFCALLFYIDLLLILRLSTTVNDFRKRMIFFFNLS